MAFESVGVEVNAKKSEPYYPLMQLVHHRITETQIRNALETTNIRNKNGRDNGLFIDQWRNGDIGT
jgi:hypothetical protein